MPPSEHGSAVNPPGESARFDRNSVLQKGALAVVTGAAKRVGRHIALELAEQGMDVVVHYGNSKDEAERTATEIRDKGRQAVTVSADLSDPVQAAETIFESADSLGRAAVLINSAAIFEDADIDSVDQQHCDRHFSINALAPLFLMQQIARRTSSPDTAHVVNIIDWRPQRPPPTFAVYTASKAALLSLTRSMAQSLAPAVRVNAIAPGAILPPPHDPEWHNLRADTIPLGQPGCPHDIAAAVTFLLRSSFINGELLHVTGGEELWTADPH